jgi:hypothetical protein
MDIRQMNEGIRSFSEGEICSIEVVRKGDIFVAKIKFEEDTAVREYRANNFESILEQLHMNLQDKFEEMFM